MTTDFTILTLFPKWFDGPLRESICGRALEQNLVSIGVRDIRDWAVDKHRTVDDSPYGGGGGMLMKPEPVASALDATAGKPHAPGRALVVYTSPRGKPWSQQDAERFAALDGPIVILCGRYEGLDQRIIDTRVDEEISLGDFVLTGGEIAALAIVDSVIRLLPGVLGNESSAANDSFTTGLLEAPHYTRPEVFEGLSVPDVLLSGNHAAVDHWRLQEALRITQERRPDLCEKWLARNPPPVAGRRRKRK